MSLTTRKSRVSMMVLGLVALVAASCTSEQRAPTSPSQLSPIAGINGVVQEYWITLADEVPAPAPGPGGNTGSWPPGPPPTAAPGVPVPTPPSTHMRMSVRVDPEPVLHSGQPITDSAYCLSNLPRYTWYYDQHISTDTGVPVTITERENFFDGRFSSRNAQTIVIPGNNKVILHTRWCSGVNAFHYAQTRFKARDEYGEQFTLSGPWVRLYKP